MAPTDSKLSFSSGGLGISTKRKLRTGLLNARTTGKQVTRKRWRTGLQELIRADNLRPLRAADKNQYINNEDCTETKKLLDKWGEHSKIVVEVKRAWEELQRSGLEADSSSMIRGIP